VHGTKEVMMQQTHTFPSTPFPTWPDRRPRHLRRLVATPLGDVVLMAEAKSLTAVHLPEEVDRGMPADEGSLESSPGHPGGANDDAGAREVLDTAAAQLDAYFAGTLRAFDLPLHFEGTPFQRQVWGALQDIPFGATVSYGELASRVGRPGAARAVGRAVGQNPLAIIVPCHRVVGADGTLTGYGGGLEAKAALLSLEGHSLPV
jgi:O-6-methylguanine DNA methyltransferase